MIAGYAKDQIEIVRRIAERGLKHAQGTRNNQYIDLFQHILDELARIK